MSGVFSTTTASRRAHTYYARKTQDWPLRGPPESLGPRAPGAATVGENRQTTTMIAPGDGSWNFSMPEIPAMPNIEIPRFQLSSQNPMLGIVGESLGQEDQLAEFFGVQEGVLVRSVKKGSAAEKAGIKAGDVITKVDDSKVASSTEITRVLRGLKSKKTFGVTVVRNRKEMPLNVTMESTGSTVRAALAEVNC